MGLFDRVIIECALPDEAADSVKEWQTKDFDDPYMLNYRIGADRRLYSENIHYEDRSDPLAEGVFKLIGCMTPVHESWSDMNFHGTLNFYGDSNSGKLMGLSMQPENFLHDTLNPPALEWFEYEAKFTDGQLVSIKRIGPGEGE